MFRFAVCCFAIIAGSASAEESAFRPAKHCAGELKLVSGVPVLVVSGKPAEVGEQLGTLLGKNSPDPRPVLDEFLKDVGQTKAFGFIKILATGRKGNFTADHRAEIEALSKASGYEPELLWFANQVYDLSSGMGCSTVVVESNRSKTGKPIFGRNFDWVPSKGLPQQAAVFVIRTEGKFAFASITLAPITGVISGMNEHGLCVTINEIHLSQSKDQAKFKTDGTPTLMAFRRVLEECKTVADAEKFLGGLKRMSTASMSICDANGGAVFEITPDTIAKRTATNDITLCTNHFTSETLGIAPKKECWRLAKLQKTQAGDAKLGVDEVFEQLAGVSERKETLQSMVFEPESRTLHLKIGDGQSSATKAKAAVIDLGKLMK